MSFNDDKRTNKREFIVLLEMPAFPPKPTETPGDKTAAAKQMAKYVGAYAWSVRRMKIAFASRAVSLKDVFKLAASMAAAGTGPYSPFNPIFKLKNPLNEMANLLPDIITIRNPKWDDSKIQVKAAPFPTAKYFNLLFLSYLASHKVEVEKEIDPKILAAAESKGEDPPKPKLVMRNVAGPHFQLLGQLDVLGLKFPSIDFAVGPNVKGGIRLNGRLGGK